MVELEKVWALCPIYKIKALGFDPFMYLFFINYNLFITFPFFVFFLEAFI